MISVQGSFVPSGRAGFFFLFALEPGAGTHLAKRRALSVHPTAVSLDALYPVLRDMPYASALTCVVHLLEGKDLVPAKVPGIALGLTNAIQWLIDLNRAFATPGLLPAQSLRAWSAAAKLVLELLGRGRFLPMLRAEAGCLTSDWCLTAPEPEDTERIDQLAAALPDLCRTIVPPDRKHKVYRLPTASALVDQFMQQATGALAREFLTMPVDLPGQPVTPSAAYHWVLGLSGQGRSDLPPGLLDAHRLYAAVDAWAAPASGVRGHGALRTGIRLILPDETDHGEWEIELILQTAGDIPVTVTAQAAWETLGGELAIDSQRYHDPGQRVLMDLPSLIRLCPELKPLQFLATPSRLAVDEAAILSLLQEGAPLLQQAGFPVLLPAGLARTASLRATMNLRPASEAQSQFGLSQLIKVDWQLALGGVTLSYQELQQLAQQKRHVVHHQGRWVPIDRQGLAAALRKLDPYRSHVPLGQALRLAAGSGDQNDLLQITETTAEGWVAALLGRIESHAKMDPVPVPVDFIGVLRPYQQRGLDWLAFLRRYGLGGCLADDMGLGKTIQLIALLLYERAEGWTDKPTLIVCPVSLVGNWKRELTRFAPGLTVMVHHGVGRASEDSFQAEALRHDVVITTYSLVARDEIELTAVEWAGIVADEAQNLKNPTTNHAQALRRVPAGYRLALTGTPVENHLGDLWALFSFVNPGFLGSQEEFRRTFSIPIERYRDPDATAQLRRLVQPFLLRRLKTDPTIINDLPEKIENSVFTSLTVEQAALYEAVVQDTLERAAETEGIQRHGAVLAGLTRLKQVCNHPTHLVNDHGPLEGRSGKLDRLTAMLEEVLAQGDKALIFTQFATFGGRLQQYLARRFGCLVLFLDGGTPREERERLIERFQTGEAPLFVLSLKAGGVGINLTAANHVFHYDRWWNPAVEDQATDRAFRIGQTRSVLVHKLVTAGTLEEKIAQLLTEKRELSDQVIGSGEAWLSNFTTEELRDLITLQWEG